MIEYAKLNFIETSRVQHNEYAFSTYLITIVILFVNYH